MNEIVYYISDHGYGHAARSIALIREIAKKNYIKITIKTGRSLNFLKDSLKSYKNIEYVYSKNDVGIILKKNSLRANKIIMKREIEKWINTWGNKIKNEISFIEKNNIDLIISDITPWPFIVARKMGINSIAISNFTWYEIYKNYYKESKINEIIKDAYRQANYFLRLPLSNKLEIFKDIKDVGLMVRKINNNEVEIIKEGIGRGKRLVYIGMGKSVDLNYFNRMNFFDCKNYNFLFSDGVSIEGDNIFKIPADYLETQNYIAACDYVVTKAGWSTVSEALQAHVPLLIIKRIDNIEDQITTSKIENIKVGKSITIEEFNKLNFIGYLDKLDKLRVNYTSLNERYINSTGRITNHIIELLG